MIRTYSCVLSLLKIDKFCPIAWAMVCAKSTDINYRINHLFTYLNCF